MPSLMKQLLDPTAAGSLEDIVATDWFVSTGSRWSRDVWRLPGYAPGRRPSKIYWRMDGIPVRIVNELKLVAAALFLRCGDRQPVLKHTNGRAFTLAARDLAKFMVEASYPSVGDLDMAAFGLFQKYVRKVASRPTMPTVDVGIDKAAAPKATRSKATKPSSTGTGDVEVDNRTTLYVETQLSLWRWLYLVKRTLANAGVPMQLPDVFDKISMPLVVAKLAREVDSEVEDLPDEVVVPILTEAHRLIGEPAEQVIRLQKEFAALGQWTHRRMADRLRGERVSMIERETFTIEGEAGPWFTPADGWEDQPALVMHELIRLIRDACLVVLAAGIGWRISEAASIEVEEQDDDRLPSCIITAPSYTSTSEHFFVRGLLSKQQPEPTEEDWLIGARLAGTATEPMTVRAIRVLERLYRPWRSMGSTPMLRRQLIVDWTGTSLPFSSHSIRRMMIEQIRVSSQEWIQKRVKLGTVLEPLVGSDPRLAAYAKDDGACIRPHQWRRTFFRLMYRNNPALLPAISRHFKHVSLAVTENGYAPRSPAAAEERDAVATSELVELLFMRAEGGELPVTGGDKTLARNQSLLATIVDGGPLKEAGLRLAEFALSRDIKLWPTEHGGCLIGLNPDKAACHVRGGTVDARVDRPNHRTRNPSLCCSCPNLVITRKDARYWQRRYVAYRDAWIRSGRDPAFRASRDRARQARTILERLGALPKELTTDKEIMA